MERDFGVNTKSKVQVQCSNPEGDRDKGVEIRIALLIGVMGPTHLRL